MDIFNIFRPKPKQCSSCGKTLRDLHNIYSGLRKGELVEKLCTECLISKLQTHIKGKNILFIEPMTADGYCFTPIDSDMTGEMTRERTKQALTSLDTKCVQCSSVPHYLWMPCTDLDEDAMEQQKGGYYSVPSIPSAWKTTASMCDKHLLSMLQKYIEDSKYYFGTFRFPDSSQSGYYD